MPTVRTIQKFALGGCVQLTDVELPDIERIGVGAFNNCHNLRRITIPLKDNMFPIHPHQQRYTQFDECDDLATVGLIGVEGIHKTISSFLLKRWRDEMNQEIDRINQVLPDTHTDEKTETIRLWIRSVLDRMEHYKAEHYALLKVAATLLELALWKAKLDEKESERSRNEKAAKKAKMDVESSRKERRITSGASIVIKNVLPFLQLDDGLLL
jgi:hypothetical protein